MMLLPIRRVDPEISPSSALKTEYRRSRPNRAPILGAVIVASALLQTCATLYSDTTVAAETGGLISGKGAGTNIGKPADRSADKDSDKSAGKGADKESDKSAGRGADKESDKSAGKGADKRSD